MLPAHAELGEPSHRPVLLNELIELLAIRPGSIVVDGTAGAGGHTRAIAERVGASGLVIAVDRDPRMLELAAAATRGLPVRLRQASYSELSHVLAEMEIDSVDRVVLDLGLSSDQLAWSERGFSFSSDGPLDMRFDASEGETAADLVNHLKAEDLADIFYEFGEERFSRRVARRIVEERRRERITTTARLADIVRRAIPGRRGPIDPATRVFQALRIAVNQELDHLEAALERLPGWIKQGGRAAVLSFHSLEDRRVKQAFRGNDDWRPLTKKPVTATDEEIRNNPRARSAKLRVAERCTEPIRRT